MNKNKNEKCNKGENGTVDGDGLVARKVIAERDGKRTKGLRWCDNVSQSSVMTRAPRCNLKKKLRAQTVWLHKRESDATLPVERQRYD